MILQPKGERYDQKFKGQVVAAYQDRISIWRITRITLAVVKLAEAKEGFVLLPRRWVVERPFGWIARCRRLARDYERLPTTFAGLHWIMFSGLLLARLHFQSFVSS